MPEPSKTRSLTYGEAISEALVQSMERDKRIFLFGIGVDDPKGIFGTTLEAARRFGPARVFDTPVSENALTGLAIGAALTGLRPILVHARNDFMYYSFDQLANHAAKWAYMFGSHASVPMVIRAIVGKGWGQGPQHSQSLQALFGHIPGLKVAMPATAYDVKGILLSAVKDSSPVIIIEHRRLYDLRSPVPRVAYTLPIGKGCLVREGRDVTLVAISYMLPAALEAADLLKKENIHVEIVDPRWIKPLDEELFLKSVRHTGRLLILDTSWKTYGVSAEFAALAAEKAFHHLKAPIQRIALADHPAPTSSELESHFYPGTDQIVAAVRSLTGARLPAKRVHAKGITPPALSSKKDYTRPF